MKLEEMKVSDLQKLMCLFKGSDDVCERDLGTNIVILQRGWVFVGELSQCGSEMTLKKASNVRKWGTEKGLGELAEKGKLKDTVLDPSPDISFHELTVIARLKCNEKNW